MLGLILPLEQIIFGLVMVILAGGAIGFAWRVGGLALKGLSQTPDPETPDVSAPETRIPAIKPFPTQVVCLEDAVFRNSDGSFTAGYRLDPPSTLVAPDDDLNAMNEAWATLIGLDKPAGTVLQFRTSVQPDPGLLWKAHLDELIANSDGIHAPARILHKADMEFWRSQIQEGHYRRLTTTLWVRVPVRHRLDSATNGFRIAWIMLREAFLEKGLAGLKDIFLPSIRTAVENVFEGDGLIRRLEAFEREAREEAEELFRRIEMASPVPLTRLSEGEMWEAYYLSHNERAQSVPKIDFAEADLREFQSDELDFGKWYVTHGNTPACVVSMIRPPQTSWVSCMRPVVMNPGLRFRTVNVVEHITPDQEAKRKELDKRRKSLKASGNKAFSSSREMTDEAVASIRDVNLVRAEMAAGETIGTMRHYCVVYGAPIFEDGERKEAIRLLKVRADMVEAAYRLVPGVNATIESAEALRVIYPRTLVGEFSPATTGREILEMNSSLAPLLEIEAGFKGSRNPNFLYRCIRPGEMGGINIKTLSEAPTMGIFGQTRSGKSVIAAALLKGALAAIPGCRVNILDFESFGNFAEIMDGVRFVFNEYEPKGFNVWYYEGIEDGINPDEAQLTLVTADLAKLAKVPFDDYLMEALIKPIVKETYENEVAKNSPGCDFPSEPILSDFLDTLGVRVRGNSFHSELVRQKAEELYIRLEQYRGNAWLDAPMHESYKKPTPLAVYDLHSLKDFQAEIRESLAFRVGTRVLRSIGRIVAKDADGVPVRTPVINLIDEMNRIKTDYPALLYAGEVGARQGGKENVHTIFIAQNVEDLTCMPGIFKNLGSMIIGRQADDLDALTQAIKLSPDALDSIRAIHNVHGSHMQFLLVVGSGDEQKAQPIEVALSPQMYWALTSLPEETNAVRKVQSRRPDWSRLDVVDYLANRYPKGMVSQGIRDIPETELPERIRENRQAVNALR
jgi:hypothetical protein